MSGKELETAGIYVESAGARYVAGFSPLTTWDECPPPLPEFRHMATAFLRVGGRAFEEAVGTCGW
jgi:hypothetical protein